MSSSPKNGGGPGVVLEAIRRSSGITRAEIAAATGLSRSTIAIRLGQLESHNLIRTAGDRESTGGRPADFITFNATAGLILAADLDADRARIGITDMNGDVLLEATETIDAAKGPDQILSWLEERFIALLATKSLSVDRIRGVGISLAAPVDHMTGRPVRALIMPGWDDYDIPARLLSRFGVPVCVDKDANLMALAEHRLQLKEVRHLVFVKIETGIGSGLVLNGSIFHGVDGAAGDIGHLPVPHGDPTPCRCGNVGCLAAVASGSAIVRRLNQAGQRTANTGDLITLIESGDSETIRLVRESSNTIGEVLVSAVNILNPELIVVGGEIARTSQVVLAGIRSAVYQRSVPFATRRLRIVASRLDGRAGMIGAALSAVDRAMAVETIDKMIVGD